MKGLKDTLEDIEINRKAANDLLVDLGEVEAVTNCVLIIEDDKVASKLLEKLVSKMKYRVRTYEDPVQGLDDAKNYIVELLFLDMKLPNMNGLEFLKALREIQENSDFPVVVMTGYTQKEMVQEIMKHNINGLLAKPLDLKRAISYLKDFGANALK